MDATQEDGSFGRLINHDKLDSNLLMKVMVVAGTPQIVFFASKDICAGSELVYDYGERRKEVLEGLQWLK